MKTKGILLPVMLLILMSSTIVGLGVPPNLSPTGNQTTILSIQERELNLRPHQDLSVRSHRILQKSAASAVPQYEEHETIIIKSDADFVTLGFPGDGSPKNPYFIEGLNITRSTMPLIQIKHTTVYFHVRNNFLNGLTSGGPYHGGIHLSYVSHGTIASNIITNCKVGILMEHSKEIMVSHNTVSNNGRTGIHLRYDENNTLSHNTVNNAGVGVRLEISEYTLISHNTVSNNQYGIYLTNSGQNTLFNNTVISNNRSGIYLLESGQNTLLHNNLVNNGLIVEGSPDQCLQGTVGDNLVNGRHLVYWQNVMGGTVPPGAGQVILINTTAVEVMGQNLSHASIGLFAIVSSNLDIHHNTVSNNSRIGIHLRDVGNSTLSHNTVTNNTEGGVLFEKSENTSFTLNTVSNNRGGIDLSDSEDTIVSHNTISNNRGGITLSDSEDTIISHNTILNNDRSGIILNKSGNTTVIHNAVSNTSNYDEIHYPGPFPVGTGIILVTCVNNTISNNTISHNISDGIHVWNLNDTIISYNTILTNGETGIFIERESDYNVIFHNTISNNDRTGIYLGGSGQNTLLGNNLVNNSLLIGCRKIEKCSKINVTDNLVNGRPLVYWQNVIGGTVPPGAGQVILVNTTAVEVTGQDLSRASIGLFAIFSSNLYIHHNTASNNSRTGIDLRDVENSTLSHNMVSNNGGTGIYLRDVGNSTLSHNTVSNNGETGIVIVSDSDNNDLSNNTVSNNGETGIVLGTSEQNTVKWNNFRGNNPGGGSQARDKGTDNVFTSNYWDDHDNTDRDGDGVADAPYAIDGAANNQDSSPLVAPAVIEATTLPKIPEFKGFLTFIAIPFLLWLRRRSHLQ